MQIVDYLQTQREIKAVTLINRRYHALFRDFLYRFNIRHRESSVLHWAAAYGRESVARKALHLGANVNRTLSEASSLLRWHMKINRCSPTALHLAVWNGHISIVKLLLDAGADANAQVLTPTSLVLEFCTLSDHLAAGSTLLHIAAWHGHRKILDLLLEARADVEARDYRDWTPLYAALASGHEKIARTICQHMGREPVNSCILCPTEGLKPLHVAAQYGLSTSVRYFLRLGSDVDIRDSSGKTALHHALLATSSRYRLNGEVQPRDKDLFKTVLTLLDVGANPELEFTATEGSTTTTARQIWALHSDERIKGLFGGCVVERLIPLSSSRIGRAWMSSPGEMQYHSIQVTLPGSRRQLSVPKTKDELFPALGTSKTPELQTPSPDSLWSRANVENLVSKMAAADEPELPASAPPDPIEPFPQLSTNIQKSSLDTAAINMWRNLGKAKQHVEKEQKCSKSDSGGKSSANNNRKAGQRKGKWKTLAL
jgi:ankyrin repeat protein